MVGVVRAVYSAPNTTDRVFEADPSDPKYQGTNGRTTGPSAHVLNAGQVDVDRPSEPKRDPTKSTGELTYLSQLRTQLTGVQDDINEYLTRQMEVAKQKSKKAKLDAEQDRRIQEEITELLDGGDGTE